MIGVAAEYEAVRRHAAVVDRSARGRVRFSGAKAVETLDGLVTNHVGALAAGQGAYAAALTPKGKIVADVRIFVDSDSILADCSAKAWDGWWSILRKYVNPRLSAYRDEREAIHDVGVFGPESADVIAALFDADPNVLRGMDRYSHATLAAGMDRVQVARVPDLGVDGYELFGRPEMCASILAGARKRGTVVAGEEACEIMRVEAGRPAWGIDMDDTTLTQEANLDDLAGISYTKGCYTGQEVVARLHFRGHVNRRLLGVRADSAEPPPTGATLVDAEGKTVGDVRSSVTSPRLGGIGLAMIRREIEPGAELVARSEEGIREQKVLVVALPFPS